MYEDKNMEKKFWVSDGNWTHDFPDTSQML